MKKIFRIIFIFIGLFLIICVTVFFFQEKLIFLPEKLQANHKYDFTQEFTEITLRSEDSMILNGLLFKVDNPKGVIFYLHGNAGSLQNWGNVAETYNNLGYDIFLLDYRGYGKSEGKINNEQQLFSDVQIAYDYVKNLYDEKNIIVLGYSIGTGPAAKVASDNNPRLLILQAPYYSLIDMMDERFPIFPKSLLKYKFETNKHIVNCVMPIVIFHGTNDNVIPYNSSIKLKKLFKPSDTLITLLGEGHNGMTESYEYIRGLKKVLIK